MTMALYAVRPGDLDYGHICGCGSPKHRQSRRCRACYTDLRRAGVYPDPPQSPGRKPDPANAHKRKHRTTGRSSARPQPESHPWRKLDAVLFKRDAA